MNELQGAEKTEAAQPLKKRTNPLRWLPWGKLFLPLAILLALALGGLRDAQLPFLREQSHPSGL